MQFKQNSPDAIRSQFNRFTLKDAAGSTRIVFLSDASPASQNRSQLDYQGLEGQFSFSGTNIAFQQSPLGLLITVTLKPNLDAGGLDVTLVLPPIESGELDRLEFETIAIKTASRGRTVDPTGAFLTYEALSLSGIVSFPLSSIS